MMKPKFDFRIKIPDWMKGERIQTQVPKLEPSSKPTLVLDMDKTMLTTEVCMCVLTIKGSSVRRSWRNDKFDYNVYLRPGLTEFLRAMADKYDIVVFTAASQGYADCILNTLDQERVLFQHRLYKQHCCKKVKDVSTLGRDMRHLVMVDDNPLSFSGNESNAIQISPFDPQGGEDHELEKLTRLLLKLAEADDVRETIRVEMAERENLQASGFIQPAAVSAAA